MQYNDIAFLKKGARLNSIGFVLKGIILAGVIFFVVAKLKEHPLHIAMLAQLLGNIFAQKPFWILLLPFILAPLNWLIEAYKWKILVLKIQKVTLFGALKGIITGLSLGFVTPHALGDYAGRIWQLSDKKRLESIGAIMIGRAAQYFATFSFGVVGLMYYLFLPESPSDFFIYSACFFSLCFFSGLWLFLSFRATFLKLLSFKSLQKIRRYFEIITSYSKKEVTLVIGLAFLRYGVFVFQFYLLLYLFDVSPDQLFLLAGVFWTFLLKSSIPSFNFLSDLGIREFSALFFFNHFQSNDLLVVLASFALWSINVLLPAVLGLSGLVSMKIFNKR